MHEISICQSIINTIEDEFEHTEVERIREIHLKVGVLSTIEPELLKHVFEFMKLDSRVQNAILLVDLVKVTASCDNCGEKFKVEKYKFVCPACGQLVTDITGGRELLIHKIILEEPSYAEIDQ
jgi:hydrogenase nickel incorporation protein HypA/HybF